MNDQQRIKECILTTAIYYGRDMTPAVLAMMAEDFSGHDANEIVAAYSEYRKNPKNRAFPLPAQIMDIISPVRSDKEIGNEVAGTIWAAIDTYGSYRSNEARAAIGEVGWEVVRLMGGWVGICESTMEHDRGTFYAQCRDLAESISRRKTAEDFRSRIAYDPVPQVESQEAGK